MSPPRPSIARISESEPIVDSTSFRPYAVLAMAGDATYAALETVGDNERARPLIEARIAALEMIYGP